MKNYNTLPQEQKESINPKLKTPEERLRYNREYKLKNKDKVKSINKKYYLKNKEKIISKQKEINEEKKKEDPDFYKKVYSKYKKSYKKAYDKQYVLNKDKKLLKSKIYRNNNPKKVNETQKKWKEENKEKVREYFRNYYNENKELNSIRAKTRNTFKELKFVCEKCGSKDKLEFHHDKPYRYDKFRVLCRGCHLLEHNKEKRI